MILGIGADIVSNTRMESAVSRHGERLAKRLFSEEERIYFRSLGRKRAARSIGASFAAKEAVAKALGTGFRYGITFSDIRIVREPHGKPLVKLSGKAAEFARRMGTRLVHLSISHEKSHSLAVAVLES